MISTISQKTPTGTAFFATVFALALLATSLSAQHVNDGVDAGRTPPSMSPLRNAGLMRVLMICDETASVRSPSDRNRLRYEPCALQRQRHPGVVLLAADSPVPAELIAVLLDRNATEIGTVATTICWRSRVLAPRAARQVGPRTGAEIPAIDDSPNQRRKVDCRNAAAASSATSNSAVRIRI
jgi:hypothetical protein